ncbi:response regulator [Rhodobacteraceae bacterium R_SAG7]|uniref:response regulator n=1 Tax=Ruegeria sp. (strain TM1040) TaxID=292414 RepID=UPI0000555EB6|nr:response regulator [Ruegeria sp. TM1040]ABF64730.1 response regulator receiver protein [Ruegeria sp. TM1040]NKW77974.1 response regulator [Rhodobacteraceae bacterium R_SAG7]
MTRQMNILLVEDDDLDAMMIKRAMAQVAPDAHLIRATDGVEALEIVQSNRVEDPYFILLDVNMPRMNGHEFLKELRASSEHSDTMVFMFTTSESARDIARAYQERANGYIVKPHGKAAMNSILDTLQRYWTTCEPPRTLA